MRILQVVPFFAPAWGYGGPPRIVLDQSRALVKRGHAVEVVTTDALDATSRVAKRTDTIDGIRVTYLPNLSNHLAWHQKAFLPLGAGSALREAAARADVAHLTDFRTGLHLAAHAQLTAAGVPYVLQPCGSLPRAGRLKRWIKWVFDACGGAALVRDAAALLAVSAHEMDEFATLGGRRDRMVIVPHAVDLDELAVLPPRGSFRRAQGVAEHEVLLLFLGRINEHKGIETLLRAFARLAATRPEVRLALVGRDDGFLTRTLELIRELGVEGRASFAGPLYGADRLTAYVDADLFVMTPSHHEETSVAALEALGCGTPALVTEQAPVPGLAESGAGLQVEHDVGSIHAALASLVADRAALRERGARARELVAQRFGWPAVVDQLERIYDAACRQAQGKAAGTTRS
jgi:glycosyltransferase involved in cell wall biosynthesis